MASSFLQEKLKALKSIKPRRKEKNSVTANGELVIEVEELTNRPTKAWEKLKMFHPIQQLPPDMYVQQPRSDNMLRFVCLSDTHGAAEQPRREYGKRIPNGDVLIHCGDFSMGGDAYEIIQFDSFIGRLPHPVKLVIAGNHEMTFEGVGYGVHPEMVRQRLGLPLTAPESVVVAASKALLKNILYMEDETIEICGIKIYGSPWVPTFGTWGFSVNRGVSLLEKWNQIPSDTDILVTHGPPLGYGDDTGVGDKKAGCAELLNTVVKRVRPKFHVFGHIHDGYGMWTNGKTTFINAAVCNNNYKPDKDPIVFDFPLPRGYSRQDFSHLSTESLLQAMNRRTELPTEVNGCGVVDDSDARRKPEKRFMDSIGKELAERSRNGKSKGAVEKCRSGTSKGGANKESVGRKKESSRDGPDTKSRDAARKASLNKTNKRSETVNGVATATGGDPGVVEGSNASQKEQ